MKLKELRAELLRELPSVDARVILSLATGWDDVALISRSDEDVDEARCKMARSLAKERIHGTPMAYLSGEKEFYGHRFHVSPSVLIPRPDTETLVELVINLSKSYTSPKILDLCTGSGAIAASIAYETGLDVSASDISESALEIAKENYLRITGRTLDARLGNLFEPWAGSSFDIIATNPPYLTEKWYEETEIDVKAEPIEAFIGGDEDGLAIIREIIEKSPSMLKANGLLAIECDYRQAGICASLLEMGGFFDIHIEKDLSGKERVAYGRRLP